MFKFIKDKIFFFIKTSHFEPKLKTFNLLLKKSRNLSGIKSDIFKIWSNDNGDRFRMLTSHVNINMCIHLCIVIDCLIFELVSTSWNWRRKKTWNASRTAADGWLMDSDTIHISICHFIKRERRVSNLRHEILQFMFKTILLTFHEIASGKFSKK